MNFINAGGVCAPISGRSVAICRDEPLVSIVVPVLNEAALVDDFVTALIDGLVDCPFAFEVVFVDDGSTDGTFSVLERLAARYPFVKAARLSRNFGKEAALTAGLAMAAGQAVIPMDVDLQDPVSVVPQLVTQWLRGFDVVTAVRSRRGDGVLKRLTASAFYRVFNLMSRTKIPADVGDFRLMDSRVVAVLLRLHETNRMLKGCYGWVGFETASVFYDRPPRLNSESRFNFWSLLRLGLDGIFGFSSTPLKVWSLVGGWIALTAMFAAAALMITTMFYGNAVPGYASLMTAVLFLGGLQLLSIGVLGEYLARVYSESLGRPLFIVDVVVGGAARTSRDRKVKLRAVEKVGVE